MSLLSLQLVGSPTSQFFFDLSVLYAKDVVCPEGFDLLFAIAFPDGQWSVSTHLDTNAPRVSLSEMIQKVQEADLAVPHMFCQTGLTSIRILFEEILHIPLVGASGQVLSIAQNKHFTKLIAQDLGISVPKGYCTTSTVIAPEILRGLSWPVIVKPNCADNSEGLSLVKEKGALSEAIKKALHFDKEVLLEAFIPGRELRGAIIKQGKQYYTPAFIEYGVSQVHPIREREDKLKFQEDGQLLAQSERHHVPAECPATLTDALKAELTQMMITLHEGLHCRDFSMYDFRIQIQTGKPYLLEAGLFWSFSKTSMISSMLLADGTHLVEITKALWTAAARRAVA
ncbi:MAG: D-alanine--D-alanine ligase [Bacteroidota bacterium]